MVASFPESMTKRRRVEVDLLQLVHGRLATTVALYMAALGIWGLASYLRGGTLSSSFSGALVIGEALVIVQVAAGVGMFAAGVPIPGSIHYLYGLTAVLVLPFAWSYFRNRDQRQALLIYSLITLFTFGLAIRGILTSS
jgi:heme A synthase